MSIIKIDANRVLIKAAYPEKITGEWKKVVDEIVDTCKKNLGQKLISVYVGGSVAVGEAVMNKSDVDAYSIVDIPKADLESEYKKWADPERKRIDKLYPFQRGVEIHLISKEHISEGKKFQMKLSSACVFGEDLSLTYPPYVLNKETVARIRIDRSKDISVARKELNETDDPKEIKNIGEWIAKRLIRGAGTLVIWKEDFYTMDIEPLVQLFIRNYPNKKQDIEMLMEYTVNPPKEKETLFKMFDSFGAWLVEEDERVFGK